ncbi:thermonuclease family protein [Lewinella sp. JB7]|uniref:thermonuclease family protein n=1 Tax=Lewinella sp. JB7 TaxID=2962887 RepID=UPI0020C9507F|nr:thermonuclease family protein [Lewinella sp. JB7]
MAYVFDGDTLRLVGKTRLRTRLWGVDAPEKGEAGSDRARDALITLAGGRKITYIPIDTDRYGRTVARVFLRDGREINRLLIDSGVAKEYCRYSKGFYGRCK